MCVCHICCQDEQTELVMQARARSQFSWTSCSTGKSAFDQFMCSALSLLPITGDGSLLPVSDDGSLLPMTGDGCLLPITGDGSFFQ